MSRASVTTTPSKPSCSRSSASTFGLSVAGSSWSIARTRRWEVITAATPASKVAANGTSSRAVRVAASAVTTGSSRWLSWSVSPWPGKCLEHAATPVSWTPITQAAACAATSAASDPKLRVPMTGLSGVLLTSATGPRTR